MTFQDWKRDTKERLREDGLHGAKRSIYELAIGGLRRLDRTVEFGTPVWDHEWDVLLILDACRADLMAEVADEYDFVDEGTTTSVAGGSRSWMLRTFAEEYADQAGETVYVTGNPFSDEVLEESQFYDLEEVWRYAWDEDLNTVPARPMTDVAISKWRSTPARRMIVHYMQPHHPFVPDPMDPGMNRENLKNPERPIWQQIKDGDADREEVWEAYRENLRYVLYDVELLLENLNAETVAISADHGNAVGEWGVYGHGDVPIPSIRRVPWCTTSATDTGEHDPAFDPDEDGLAVEDKLRDLGYLSSE